MEVLELDRLDAEEKERLRLEELKEQGEVLLSDNDLKSPVSDSSKNNTMKTGL
jgi:hypothetical protein